MLCRTEREQRVIELHQQGKTIREIAQDVHMSFGDIGAIVRKATGPEDDQESFLCIYPCHNISEFYPPPYSPFLFHPFVKSLKVQICTGDCCVLNPYRYTRTARYCYLLLPLLCQCYQESLAFVLT
jgi:hypothetical protein